jgi:two-component system, NtrC family, nitrogen regulation response regulator GlnG
LPALRDRREDVPLLARHLLERIGAQETTIDADAEAAMVAYEWPGNVRELLNVLRRCVLFADSPVIDGALMRRMLAASVFGHAEQRPERISATSLPPISAAPSASERGDRSLAELERTHIEEVLARCDGNVTRAATALGIDRRTLQRKLKGLRSLAR